MSIAYPIGYLIGSHWVYPNRGRIPRPDPSRPAPFTTTPLALATHLQTAPRHSAIACEGVGR